MSKATVITSETMGRQVDPELDSGTIPTPKAPTVASVVKAIAKTREEFGTPGQADSAHGKASEALDRLAKQTEEARDTIRKSETAKRRWIAVAVMSSQSTQSASEFGRLAGGNPNTRARLVRAGEILRASRAAKIPVPFWQAVADGNATSAKRSQTVVASLANGVDPYASTETTETGKAVTEPKGRRTKTYRLSDAADALRAWVKVAPKDESLSDADWADLDKAVRAFAVVVSKRAGTTKPRASRTAPKVTGKAA